MKIRTFAGNAPSDGVVCAVHEFWALYVRKINGTWCNVKLVSREPRNGKANFHMSYCMESLRFAHRPDEKQLRACFPEVHAWLETEMERYVQIRNGYKAVHTKHDSAGTHQAASDNGVCPE